MTEQVCHLDFETYSAVDLTKVGHYRYAEDPSTEILMCSYKAPAMAEVKLWVPAEGEPMPAALRDMLADSGVLLSAWNAAFERQIIANKLPEFDIPVTRWRCAMVDAMAKGLPGKLEHAGPAIGLPEALFKQEGGRKLINRFCKPRKPSKKNPDTRWTPQSSPEEWATFKAYCLQDTRAEAAIWDKLEVWRLPASEQHLWEMDQRMNDRGIQVDVPLVRAAHEMGLMHRAILVERAKSLTGLGNPNSVKQLMDWLNDQPDFDPDEDTEVENLRKKTVEKILGRDDLDDVVRQVLKLRQQIAKSSLKKYETILRAVCRDGRIRGTMQFYGANRTGRWAGRLLQVQNLPQGILEDVEIIRAVRELVRMDDYEAVVLLFGEDQVPEVLASLIRSCLIAAPGKRLVVADLSAIEARVTAWFAKCEWRLEVFRTHGMIYEASAAEAFGVPFKEFTEYKKRTGKHHPLRKKGKVIELACIAAGQLVLTNSGLVPIEDVSASMLVWDGVSFVPHKGVISRGTKEVIEYDGLTATPDHIVWTDEGPEEFGRAASRGARLTQSGAGGNPLRVGGDHLPRAPIHQGLESPLRPDEMHGVWRCPLAELCEPEAGEIERVPSLFATGDRPCVAGEASASHEEQVREADESGLPELRGAGDSLRLQVGHRGNAVDHGQPRLGERQRARPDKQQWELRSWEHPVCHEIGEHAKPAEVQAGGVRRGVGQDSEPAEYLCDPSVSPGRVSEGGDHRLGVQSGAGQTEKLARDTGSAHRARVFDLAEAGPNNRFTVSGRLVHNCGYQGGVNAMITMGALDQGLTLDELQPMVDAWRKASPEIAGTPTKEGWMEGGLWRDVENAAKKCLRTHARQEAAGCVFRYAGGMLVITLPSGRHLHYFRARITYVGKKQQIAYMGSDQKTKRWTELHTYGGKLCIIKGTPVLTDRGWVPIEAVTSLDLVWDGVEWVTQSGAVAKGVMDTIKAHGVRMTPDHEVLTVEGWKRASQSEGLDRAPCGLPDGYPLCRGERPQVTVGGNLYLREGSGPARYRVGEAGETGDHRFVWLPEESHDHQEADTTRAIETPSAPRLVEHAGPMLGTDASSLAPLRGPRDQSVPHLGRFIHGLLGRHGADIPARVDDRTEGQQRGLRARQLPMGDATGASQQSSHLDPDIGGRRADYGNGGPATAGGLSFDYLLQSAEVYDLLDCGPRHRFVVADENGQPLIVHNCENIVQALSRDILCDILLRLEGTYHPVMLVHDEGVFEEEIGHGSLEEVLVEMGRDVAFVPGLPLKGDGFENDFYMK